MGRKPIRHRSGERLIAWLVLPLLLLAAGNRSLCRCGNEVGASGDPHTRVAAVATCHNCPAPDREPERLPACPPSRDCCCVGSGATVAPAPEGATCDPHRIAWVFVGAPLVVDLGVPDAVRTVRARLRPPKAETPPLFVVNCSYRC